MNNTNMILTLFLILAICLAATLGGCYVYSDQPPLPPVVVIPGQIQVLQPQPVLPPPAPVGAPSGEVGPIRP